MRDVRLGETGIRISNVVLGGSFGERPDAVSFELLDRFVEAGGTGIETAHAYAAGAAEEQIGRWLGARRCRDRVVLVDKGCHPEGDVADRVDGDSLARDLSESLLRLGTDYIDVYLVHRDSPGRPIEPILDALYREQRHGRIRCFGVCNWTWTRIVEAWRYRPQANETRLALVSCHFSLARQREPIWPGTRQLEPAELACLADSQMPLLAWSSQAGGWFSGRFVDGERSNRDVTRVYDTRVNRARLERARYLASRRGVTSIQIALAFVLSQRFPVVASLGPASVSELSESMDASHLSLDPAECAYLTDEECDSTATLADGPEHEV